jgi:hypothetical protein
MKIFIVCAGWAYEGFRIISIHSDKKSAIYSKNKTEETGRFDYVFIDEDHKLNPPNVRDHRAGPSDPSKAKPSDVAGSGASTCWADAQSAGETP